MPDETTTTISADTAANFSPELEMRNYYIDPWIESELNGPLEIVTPSATGQGTHKRWLYLDTKALLELGYTGIPSDISWDEMFVDTGVDNAHYSHFDEYGHYIPWSSPPDSFVENPRVTMTPRSSSPTPFTAVPAPSAPKKPYCTFKALTEGEDGGKEDGDGQMEEHDDRGNLDELGDDYECLETPPRLLWERGSTGSVKVTGDNQDDDPFL